MITKWGVKNFKSILDADLELAPLTIFTGVNSSGKSSFLRSIMMLAQSVRTHDDKRITLKGNLVDLGSFEHIYNNKAELEENDEGKKLCKVGINFTVESEDKQQQINFKLEIGCDEKHKKLMTFLDKKKGEPAIFSSLLLRILTLYMDYKDTGVDDNTAYIKHWDIEKDEDTLDAVSADEIKEHLKVWNHYYPSEDDAVIRKPKVKFSESDFLPHGLVFSFKFYEDLFSKTIDFFFDLISEFPDVNLSVDEAEKYIEEKIYELREKSRAKIRYKNQENFHNLMWEIDNIMNYLKSEHVISLIGLLYDFFLSDASMEFLNLINLKRTLRLKNWYVKVSGLTEYEKKIIVDKLKNESFKDEFKKEGIMGRIDDFISFMSIQLPINLEKAQKNLETFFGSGIKFPCIKYLGPLRLSPKWEYETIGDDSENIDVDIKGENVVSIIDYLKRIDYKVENYISPENLNAKDPKYSSTRFTSALVEWMNYINFAQEFTTKKIEEKEDILPLSTPLTLDEKTKQKKFEIKMLVDDEYFDLPQLGTGVSQILPILVICLSAKVGSTIIIEQPEEQLHPKIQSKLADFFIAMALSGRQCLIETHSEYIIEWLRYRIIELSDSFFNFGNKTKQLHELTKLYFAEKRNGISYFKDIEINKYGVSDEYPEDFFDETQKILDKIFEESMKKNEAQEQDE